MFNNRLLSTVITGLFLAISVTSCTVQKATVANSSKAQFLIDSIRQLYAPDKRTVLFDVEASGNVLKGETISEAAKVALLQSFADAGISYIDSITLLPTKDVNKTKAVVTISVANLRSQPRHPAELASQATLGTPLKVWKRTQGWYLVQTPDDYLSWVDAGGITLMDNAQFANWQQQQKIIITTPYSFAYASPATNSTTVSDIVFGNVLSVLEQNNGFYKVAFPDGRQAYIVMSDATALTDWKQSLKPSNENFVAAAVKLMGLPYLWGGTSFKGVDCSGFTKTVYLMNGLILARDASQQVQQGTEIDTRQGWNNLQPGDLLFFGQKATDGKPERVVHVGMWIGNNQFIHASGQVRISSVDPSAINYDEHEHKRFLRAKRINASDALIDLRTADLF